MSECAGSVKVLLSREKYSRQSKIWNEMLSLMTGWLDERLVRCTMERINKTSPDWATLFDILWWDSPCLRSVWPVLLNLCCDWRLRLVWKIKTISAWWDQHVVWGLVSLCWWQAAPPGDRTSNIKSRVTRHCSQPADSAQSGYRGRGLISSYLESDFNWPSRQIL